jgi:hypothetical protein
MNFNTLIESILNESKHTYRVVCISDVNKSKKGVIYDTFYLLDIDGEKVELSDSHQPGKYQTLGDYYFVGDGARALIDKYSDEEYDEILEGAKKAVEAWKLKQKLTPNTKETFGGLIDEL